MIAYATDAAIPQKQHQICWDLHLEAALHHTLTNKVRKDDTHKTMRKPPDRRFIDKTTNLYHSITIDGHMGVRLLYRRAMRSIALTANRRMLQCMNCGRRPPSKLHRKQTVCRPTPFCRLHRRHAFTMVLGPHVSARCSWHEMSRRWH